MNAQHDKWLREALDQIPVELKADTDGTTHRQIADSYLRPLLKRCRATTRPRFWQWLRLTLSKTEETASYLMWMRESRCPIEIEVEPKSGFEYIVNGDTALISVGDTEHPAVWRVPASHLDWALSLYPVTLKKLPSLEPPERREIRRLKRQLRTRMPFLTPEQRSVFEQSIKELESAQGRAYSAVPRYRLLKSIEGQEIPVHRLFLDAQRNDGVEAVDGDFLNFTTAKVRVTATPVDTGGTAVAKGDRAPSAWSEEVVVPNLYVVPCDKSQKDFEESFLQVKMTPYGEPRTSLKIQPNSKWLAGVDGHIADCGPSAPVTSDEAKDAGLAGFEARGLDEVAALRRKWRVPTSWGSRW